MAVEDARSCPVLALLQTWAVGSWPVRARGEVWNGTWSLFFPSREMKTTCVMKGNPAIPWGIFHLYLTGMEICDLCSCLHVLRLRTLVVPCLRRPQEGMVLLWKRESREDQASHWLGWVRQMQKEALFWKFQGRGRILTKISSCSGVGGIMIIMASHTSPQPRSPLTPDPYL